MPIILGIDPGSRITGFGLLAKQGARIHYIESGIIRTAHQDVAGKLRQIFTDISAIVAEYQPDEVAIERVFVAKNADSALKLGQARGAAITAIANAGLTINEYSPRQVKKSVVGAGHADKHQVQHMMQVLLKLSSVPQEDAADALAIAMCHCNMTQGLAKLRLV